MASKQSAEMIAFDPGAIARAAANEEKVSSTWYQWWAPEAIWEGKLTPVPIRGVLVGRGTLRVDEEERAYYVLRTTMPTIAPESKENKLGVVIPVGSYLNVGENFDTQVLSQLLPGVGKESGDVHARVVTIIPDGKMPLKGGRQKWNLEVRSVPADVAPADLKAWIEEVRAVTKSPDVPF